MTEEDTHMADPPRYPDSEGDTGVGPDRESTTGIPRWVWVVGSIIIVASLVMLAKMLLPMLLPYVMGGMGH
jgi:hypothetical protein